MKNLLALALGVLMASCNSSPPEAKRPDSAIVWATPAPTPNPDTHYYLNKQEGTIDSYTPTLSNPFPPEPTPYVHAAHDHRDSPFLRV
jgi:hypothetical protein